MSTLDNSMQDFSETRVNISHPFLADILDRLSPPIIYAQIFRFRLESYAYIAHATPTGAKLYGFDTPEELQGRLIFETNHPEDLKITRLYAYARHYNMWAPTTYAVRIKKAPNGEPIKVVKYIRQFDLRGSSAWLTYHKPFNEIDRFVMPVTQDMIELGEKQSNQNLKKMVTESDEYLLCTEEEAMRLTERYEPLSTYENGIMDSLERILQGDFHQKRPHHICLRCGWPWYASKSQVAKHGDHYRPSACPSCADKNWDQFYLNPTIERQRKAVRRRKGPSSKMD